MNKKKGLKINPQRISNFLIGQGGVNQNGFGSLLLGRNRLRNKDNDAVPDIFDCSPNDYWRDAPIIPPQLQAQRPQTPQSLAQYQLSKLPQSQQQGISQDKINQIESLQKELSGVSYEDYFSKYENIPEDLKQYFTNPNEIKQTSDYQTYQQQLSEYNSAVENVQAYQAARNYYWRKVIPSPNMGLAGTYLRQFYQDEANAQDRMAEAESQVRRLAPPTQTFQGPVQPGVNVEAFRKTGETVQIPNYVPTPPPSTDKWVNPAQIGIEKISNLLQRGSIYAGEYLPSENRRMGEQPGTITYNQRLRDIESGKITPIPTDTTSVLVKGGVNYVTPEGIVFDYKGNILKEIGGNIDKVATKYYKDNLKYIPPNETYDSSSGMFTSSPYGKEQGTLFARPPTQEEAQQIKLQNKRNKQIDETLGGLKNPLFPTREERQYGESNFQKNFWNFGEKAQSYVESLGREASVASDAELQNRFRIENELAIEGEQLNLMSEDFKRRYKNPPTQEGTPERLMYEQELNNLNARIDAYYKKDAELEALKQTAEAKPLITLGGVGLGIGFEEGGRNLLSSVIGLPFSFASMGIGLVTNPQQEVVTIARGVGQIPEQLVKYPAATIGSLIGMALGGKILGKGVKKLATPSYSTEVMGITKTGEGGKGVTDVFFKTRESRFFGLANKDYFGIARGKSNIAGTGDISISTTQTKGVYYPKSLTEDILINKPTKFGSVSTGLSQEADVVFYNTNPPTIREGITGFISGDVGISATAKRSDYFTSAGSGIKWTDKITQVFGETGTIKNGKLLKKDISPFTGYIIKSLEEKGGETGIKVYQGGGAKSSQEYLNSLYGNVAGSVVENIKAETKPSVAPKVTSIISPLIPQLIESNYPTIVGGTQKPVQDYASGFVNLGYYNGEETYGKNPPKPRTSDFSNVLLGEGLLNPPISKPESRTRTLDIVGFSFISPTSERTRESLIQPQPQLFRQAEVQRQVTKQVQKQVQPTQPVTPKITPNEFGFGWVFGEGEKLMKEQAYFGYVKKGKSWKKETGLSTKQGAIDVVARIVDNTLSRQFKVLPATKKIEGKERFVQIEKNKLYQGDNYYAQNRNKFRTFQQKKGVRTKLPNSAIEKSKYSLDTSGETKRIQKARQDVKGFFGM